MGLANPLTVTPPPPAAAAATRGNKEIQKFKK